MFKAWVKLRLKDKMLKLDGNTSLQLPTSYQTKFNYVMEEQIDFKEKKTEVQNKMFCVALKTENV